MDQFSRTRMLIGSEGVAKLHDSRVAVFGVGGVGGYVVEALARSGIGSLDLIDKDTVSISNINRQLTATLKTTGRFKTEVAAEHIAEINPDCKVRTYNIFYLPETADSIDFTDYDYVVDAIDTVTGKLCIIENAYKCDVPVISALGAGNKLNPLLFEVDDIYNTSVCPLARVMRRECKNRGIKNLKCVYSKEKPAAPVLSEGAVSVPGTVPFVPGVAGLIIAGEVVRDLLD